MARVKQTTTEELKPVVRRAKRKNGVHRYVTRTYSIPWELEEAFDKHVEEKFLNRSNLMVAMVTRYLTEQGVIK